MGEIVILAGTRRFKARHQNASGFVPRKHLEVMNFIKSKYPDFVTVADIKQRFGFGSDAYVERVLNHLSNAGRIPSPPHKEQNDGK